MREREGESRRNRNVLRKRGSRAARAVQSDCPGSRPLSPIALQTRRMSSFFMLVCSAMEGRGRDPGQRLAL